MSVEDYLRLKTGSELAIGKRRIGFLDLNLAGTTSLSGRGSGVIDSVRQIS
jgi:hypothetical protein